MTLKPLIPHCRLVEEVKEKCNGISLENEAVYMNTVFEDFCTCVVKKGRGIEDKEPFVFHAVSGTFTCIGKHQALV